MGIFLEFGLFVCFALAIQCHKVHTEYENEGIVHETTVAPNKQKQNQQKPKQQQAQQQPKPNKQKPKSEGKKNKTKMMSLSVERESSTELFLLLLLSRRVSLLSSDLFLLSIKKKLK